MAILHLEDDLMLADIFQSAISALSDDIEIVHFAKGTDVEPYVQDNHENISVYLLDIRVRGNMTGLEVAERLREMGITDPIFMSSAYEQPSDDILESLDLGWIPKPWKVKELIKQIAPLAEAK